MQDTAQNANDPQNKALIQNGQSNIVTQPAAPSMSKEQEGVSIKPNSEEGDLKAVPEITVSAPSEVSIPPELKTFVEKGPDAVKPELPKESIPIPQQAAKPSMSVLDTAFGRIKLPMSYQSAVSMFKKTKTSDSMHWLASLVMYQWLKYNPDVINQSGKTAPQA